MQRLEGKARVHIKYLDKFMYLAIFVSKRCHQSLGPQIMLCTSYIHNDIYQGQGCILKTKYIN